MMIGRAVILALVVATSQASAAHDFSGTSGMASAGVVEATGVPLSIACLVNSDSATAAQVVLAVGDFNEASHDSYRLQLRGPTAGDPVSAVVLASTTQIQADTSSGYSAGTWHSVVAVFASTTSRSVYIDGASKGTNTTGLGASDLDATEIGAITINSIPVSFFDGRIAECGIWQGLALTDDNAATLGDRYAPDCVRRDKLIAYYKAIRDTTSIKDIFSAVSNNLTLAGTTATADHPRVINCQ